MGRPAVLLLLLALLTPGVAIPVPPAVKALSSLRWSTSFTSRHFTGAKYSVHYILQKVRRGGAGRGGRRGALGLRSPCLMDPSLGTGAHPEFQTPNA